VFDRSRLFLVIAVLMLLLFTFFPYIRSLSWYAVFRDDFQGRISDKWSVVGTYSVVEDSFGWDGWVLKPDIGSGFYIDDSKVSITTPISLYIRFYLNSISTSFSKVTLFYISSRLASGDYVEVVLYVRNDGKFEIKINEYYTFTSSSAENVIITPNGYAFQVTFFSDRVHAYLTSAVAGHSFGTSLSLTSPTTSFYNHYMLFYNYDTLDIKIDFVELSTSYTTTTTTETTTTTTTTATTTTTTTITTTTTTTIDTTTTVITTTTTVTTTDVVTITSTVTETITNTSTIYVRPTQEFAGIPTYVWLMIGVVILLILSRRKTTEGKKVIYSL
jgi:Predicted solute binding protein